MLVTTRFPVTVVAVINVLSCIGSSSYLLLFCVLLDFWSKFILLSPILVIFASLLWILFLSSLTVAFINEFFSLFSDFSVICLQLWLYFPVKIGGFIGLYFGVLIFSILLLTSLAYLVGHFICWRDLSYDILIDLMGWIPCGGTSCGIIKACLVGDEWGAIRGAASPFFANIPGL